MLDPASVSFRAAGQDDAHAIAELHADSWRRHYRGAYSDAFLDGDVAGTCWWSGPIACDTRGRA
jgi:hypothetical protein